jgi:integrase
MARRRRRSPGTGTATKEANGTWTARFPRIGGGYHVRRGFRTRQAAEGWCDSLVAARDEKRDVGQGLTHVNERITAWIARENTEREWKAKTLADVEFKLGYVRPHIGKMSMGDVLPDHIDRMLDQLGRDLAPNTIRQIRNYLYQVFEDARARRYIAYNPVLKPQRRKRPKQKEAQRLSPSQVAVLLIAAELSFYAVAWWLLVCCGLRSGEICGLRRVDMDLDSCVLHIRQESTDLRGKPHLDSPKNDKIRDVPFPRALAPLLRRHLQTLTERAAQGLKRGTWQEHGLVFPGRSGKPMNPTSVRHMLKKLTDATKLPPVTTHMLRHTAGGLLKTAGCPYDVIGAILGHAPLGVTGHYAPPPVSTMRPWVEHVYQELAGERDNAREAQS